jgi:hypothetical protein
LDLAVANSGNNTVSQGCHLSTLEKQKLTNKKQKMTESLLSKNRKKSRKTFNIKHLFKSVVF